MNLEEAWDDILTRRGVSLIGGELLHNAQDPRVVCRGPIKSIVVRDYTLFVTTEWTECACTDANGKQDPWINTPDLLELLISSMDWPCLLRLACVLTSAITRPVNPLLALLSRSRLVLAEKHSSDDRLADGR